MAYKCTSKAAVKYEALCAWIYVRCRKCENCLKARRHVFQIRAAREQMKAKATWFVTLTFGPERRARIFRLASEMENSLSQQDRLVRASGWYVTKFIKRLRKAGFEFSYMMVAEPHRDGFPHYHGIIHDQRGTLRWAALDAKWSAGYSVIKLVRDIGAIRYVTKYIAKGRFGRIRCSQKYGDEPVGETTMHSMDDSRAREANAELGERVE